MWRIHTQSTQKDKISNCTRIEKDPLAKLDLHDTEKEGGTLHGGQSEKRANGSWKPIHFFLIEIK